MMVNRNLIVFAAFNGAMAVALGAFAAHGAAPQVRTLLSTGAAYQLTHAVFALACAVWTGGGGWRGAPDGWARRAGWCSGSPWPFLACSACRPWEWWLQSAVC